MNIESIESKILESLESTLKDVNNMSLKEFAEIGETKLVKELENIPLEITSSKSLTYEQRFYILIEALKIQKELSGHNQGNNHLTSSGTKFLNERVLIQIFRRWGNDDDDIDGVFSDLASNYECPKSILKYLAESFKYCNPTTILDSYIQSRQKYDTGSIFSYVVKRVLEAYGICDNGICDNGICDNGITDSVTEVMESVDWNWLLDSGVNYQDKEVIYFIENLGDLKSKEINLPKSSFKIPKISDFKDFLKMFQISDLNPLNQRFEDILSEIYGPENEIEGMDCISGILGDLKSEEINLLKSPEIRNTCRMYTCMCREYDRDFGDLSLEDINVEYWEWFKGICEVCDKVIKDYKKAIRAPVEGGGWVGCFCSEKCFRGNI